MSSSITPAFAPAIDLHHESPLPRAVSTAARFAFRKATAMTFTGRPPSVPFDGDAGGWAGDDDAAMDSSLPNPALGRRLRARLANELLERNVVPDQLVKLQDQAARHAVGAPLADGRGGALEPFGHALNAPPLDVEPFAKGHASSLAIPKAQSQALPNAELFSLRYMTPANRRKRLQTVLDARYEGTQAKLAEATGLSEGRISQLFDDDKAFGEKAARNLESTIGLRRGFLDEPADERGVVLDPVE